MNKKHVRIWNAVERPFVVLFILSIGVLLSCSEAHRGRTQVEMKQLYSKAYELFTQIWDPNGFADRASQRRAQELVTSLSRDFHRVGKAADLRREDPIVAVTLDVTERLLSDALGDLREGRAEYAHWRLRGLAHNCVSCHSRIGAATTFLGAPPVGEPRQYGDAMTVIEFLIASRQFNEAAARLSRLSERAASEVEFSGNLVPALRMWLLLEIRIFDRPWEAAEKLSDIAKGPAVPLTDHKLLEHWIAELRLLSSPEKVSSPLDRAAVLLEPVRQSVTIAKDDWNLISTLRASRLLHELLNVQALSYEATTQANFLLALSYQHMNIRVFEGSRDLYLERCIRAFPGTPEAKEAFRLYEWNVRQSSTGSGGMHLDETDDMLIQELRTISGSTSKSEG